MKPEASIQKLNFEPERSGARDGEAEQSPKEEDVELTEDEKAVLNLLKASTPVDLNVLKAQTGLSNKKWDKAIKGLTKNKLARVEKTDAGLFVSLL
jgi:lysyl-tRNA synthetase class 2